MSNLGPLPNDGSNHFSQGVHIPGSGVAALQGALLTTGSDGQSVAVAQTARPGRAIYSVVQSITTNGDSGWQDVSGYSEFALDVIVAAPVGGTSPSITFYVDRQDVNGNSVQKYTGTALTAAGSVNLDIGAGLSTNVSLGTKARVRWVVVSTATWAIQVSLIGK